MMLLLASSTPPVQEVWGIPGYYLLLLAIAIMYILFHSGRGGGR